MSHTDHVHQIEDGPCAGRWCVAHWSDRSSEWQSYDLDVRDQSTRYGFSRALHGIPGMRTYKLRSSAVRKARAIYGS